MADALETDSDLESLLGPDGIGETLEIIDPDGTIFNVVGTFTVAATRDGGFRGPSPVSGRVIEIEIPSHQLPAGIKVGTDAVDAGKRWRVRRDAVEYFVADMGSRLDQTTTIRLSTLEVDRA